MGESSWSAEVVAMVYVSGNGDQTFNLIIILLFGAVMLGASSYIIHFSRKIKSIEAKIAKKSIEPGGKMAVKPRKLLTTDSFEVEDQISQLPLSEAEKELMRMELHGIEDEERPDVFQSVSGNLSESEAKDLWNSLMLRFNRLYKLEHWAQALLLLETLFEIAEFLGDANKFNGLSGKYDEIQEKQQQNFVNTQIY
jgi:hypothetical protein